MKGYVAEGRVNEIRVANVKLPDKYFFFFWLRRKDVGQAKARFNLS